MFEIGIAFRPCELLRDQQIAVLAGNATGVSAKLIDLADDLLVDEAGENHLHHFNSRCVRNPQASGKCALDTKPLEKLRDLRAATMHNHRFDARLLQHHDIARKAFGELGIAHRVAAILDDDGRLVVALHIRQRLR